MRWNRDGSFELSKEEAKINYLYFPLCNHYGCKSAITPMMCGDMKMDQYHFLLPPASNVELLNHPTRNIWVKTDSITWNLGGETVFQREEEDFSVEYGFLYQKIKRQNRFFSSICTSFVPEIEANAELHQFELTNLTNEPFTFQVFIEIPIYGRSADDIRDHRHVTSLLNRIVIEKQAIINTPTLSFDERGHHKNDTSYLVAVSEEVSTYYPTIDSFLGDRGSYQYPEAVFHGLEGYQEGESIGGFEALGGFKLRTITLAPNETFKTVVGLGIYQQEQEKKLILQSVQLESFQQLWHHTKLFWEHKLSTLQFNLGKNAESQWLKWVSIQPILRRIYGCSFLPHHDYGKGGKGWRDLWQDCLALLKMEPQFVRTMLINNFGGVRIDGSNATIIGEKPGEFKADRNNIVRMWMDHGAWPMISTSLYMNHFHDFDLLFEKQVYFKDSHSSFSQVIDERYCEQDGNKQKTKSGEIYYGTILEHLLLENMTMFYLVGEHGQMRLMNADWNDGLDMAYERGESVAFTALYTKNYRDLIHLLVTLKSHGHQKLSLFQEFYELISVVNQHISWLDRNNALHTFFERVKHDISGEIIEVLIDYVIEKLQIMFDICDKQIQQEWLDSGELSYFNGYYDNDGNQLEDASKGYMVLTSQVFPLMAKLANEQQINSVIQSADQLLFQQEVGGYRLNTNFNEVKFNMGRLFGFEYGHKENGAVFSHMAVMYANALYQNNRAQAGYKVLRSIFLQSKEIDKSKCLPGIPEYFDAYGRGMYPYLTGSASWLLLTMIEEVFGIKRQGDILVFYPQLTKGEFDETGSAVIHTLIGDQSIQIQYLNKNGRDAGEYRVKSVIHNGDIKLKIGINQLKKDDKIQIILE